MNGEEDSDNNETSAKKGETNNENDQDKNNIVAEIAAVDKANTDSGAVPPICEQSADILKLDIDCFEEVFDYLPLKDLISIGKTCKRLQNVCGYIFHQNYSNVLKQCAADRCDVWIKSSESINKHEVDHFWRFIDRIYIRKSNGLERFLRIHRHFKRLKQICFNSILLTMNDTERMRETLAKVQSLRFINCEVHGSFYETILAFCPNLKHLYIDRLHIVNGPSDGIEAKDPKNSRGSKHTNDISVTRNSTDSNDVNDANDQKNKSTTKNLKVRRENDWLRQKYPMLEHLELISHKSLLIELVIFFKLNPNIRKITVNDEFLWENSEVMLYVNAKLDELTISRCSEGTIFRYCEEEEEEDVEEPPRQNEASANGRANVEPKDNDKTKEGTSNENANGESSSGKRKDESHKDEPNIEKSNEYTFFELANKLYARQFYRRLRWLCQPTFFQELADEMVSINGLTKLVLNTDTDPVALSRLKNLEELHIGRSEQITDLEMLANNLTNLTQIHFQVAFFDQIFMIISQAVKLEKIQINSILDGSRRRQDGKYDNIKIINLVELNKERELLNGAGKVVIYVEEKVYLTTKWALGDSNFHLIRLKREESYEFGFDCDTLFQKFDTVIR